MTDEQDYEHDLFISYNRADEEWAERLAARLEQEDYQGRKLKVFFAPWDIQPGEHITESLEDALPQSRKVALIVTPEAMRSEWVKIERLVTTHLDIEQRQRRLLPLYRRAPDNLPPLLRGIRAINFEDDAQFEKGYRELLAVVKGERLPRGAREDAPKGVLPPSFVPRPPVVGFVPRNDASGSIVARLQEELAPHRNQLVALWGAGGVGKTTLSAEAARGLEAAGQRVVWVSADGRANFTLSTLLDDIAAQLGRTDLRPLTLELKEEALRALIGEAPTLIVLDNFETIPPNEQLPCIRFLADKAHCPALITTRELIDEALSIPLHSMLAEEGNVLLDRLIEQTSNPAIYTKATRDRILDTAEYNPLVIQWVVRQINLANDPEEVLSELARGEGKAAKRVFDRSFNLPQMDQGGRAVLLALSLFMPSATRAALSEVAGMGKEKDKKKFKKAQETLASLWLMLPSGGQRLTVEGLTREFAKARLSHDPRSKLFRQRFVNRFLSYAEANSKRTAEQLNLIEVEKDNILSAIDIALELGDWKSTMRVCSAVYEFLRLRGYWDEAIRREEQSLNVARNLADALWIAHFGHNLAVLYQEQGALDKARNLYRESLDISKRLGDQSGVAIALHELGRLAHGQGEIEEARRLYGESLDITKGLGNQSVVAAALRSLAGLAQEQGEMEEARRLYGESLEIEKKLGNQSGVADIVMGLAGLAQAQGEMEEARRLYGEGLHITKRLGDQRGLANALQGLAGLVLSQGETEEARRLYGESLHIKKKLGDQSGVATIFHELGRLTQEQGEMEEARRLYGESLYIKKRLGNSNGIAAAIHHLAMLAQEQGEIEEARRLYGESLEIHKRLGNPNGIAATLHQLAIISIDEGNLTTAENLLNESLTILRKLSHKRNIAECLESIGNLKVKQGSFPEAHRLFGESLQKAQALSDKFRIASVKHSAGLLAEKEGDAEEAGRLLREALVSFEELKSPKKRVLLQDLERVESKSGGG
jgi:tetratricopeptide (TPR) repeat protein